MGQTSTVWMVHGRTQLAGVRGTLSLQDRALLFVPDGGRSGETVIPVSSVVRVHRAKGAPVLEVAVELPNAPSVIGFYFVQPPPLAQSGSGLKLVEKVVAKRRAVIKLKLGSTAKRDEVESWVRAIKRAQAESKAQD